METDCNVHPKSAKIKEKSLRNERNVMMYIHFCKNCKRIHMLNGHKMFCPRCNQSLTELQMPYLDYVALNATERTLFMELCNDEASLKELSTTYRMYKYSKWYRNLQSASVSCAPAASSGHTSPGYSSSCLSPEALLS